MLARRGIHAQRAFSGDNGLAVIEYAPFGVIVHITRLRIRCRPSPATPASMIAGGNTLVVNPHPSGKRDAAEGVRRFNEAIDRVWASTI